MQIINKPCDKYDGAANVKVVVLHHTAGSEGGDLATLWGPAEVSIHIYITKRGVIYLGVPFGKRAWHCGTSQWRGFRDINSFSLGIELENRGNHQDPFPAPQLEALDYALVSLIRPHYGSLPITRHRDINSQKIDPANNFPWHLYSGGIGQVVERTKYQPQPTPPKPKEEYEVSIQHPDPWPVDEAGNKWRVPWFDRQTAGLQEWLMLDYPSASEPGKAYEGEVVAAIFCVDPATKKLNKLMDIVKLLPGQTLPWRGEKLGNYMGPLEVDFSKPGRCRVALSNIAVNRVS